MANNFGDPRYDALALAIGRASLAWNGLHEALAKCYRDCVAVDEDHPLDEWYKLRDDAKARKKLRDVATESSDPRHPDYIWILDQICEMSDARNIAAHAPFYLGSNGKPQPSVQFGSNRAWDAWHENPEELFGWLAETCAKLRDYAEAVNTHHLYGKPATLPSKPELRGRPPSVLPLSNFLARESVKG